MLELFHWEPNQTGLSTMICLYEKGLTFESCYVDLLAFEQYEAGFLALNPQGQVPVLRHDGKVLTDSFFINEYLEDCFPDVRLRPGTPEDNWRVRVWGKFCGEVLAPAVATLGCHAHLTPALAKREAADLQAAIERIPVVERQRGWQVAFDGYGDDLIVDSRRKIGIAVERIEKALASAQWLVGAAMTLADIELFAQMSAMGDVLPEDINADKAPALLDWLSRISERQSVMRAMTLGKTKAPHQAFAPGPEHSRWG